MHGHRLGECASPLRPHAEVQHGCACFDAFGKYVRKYTYLPRAADAWRGNRLARVPLKARSPSAISAPFVAASLASARSIACTAAVISLRSSADSQSVVSSFSASGCHVTVKRVIGDEATTRVAPRQSMWQFQAAPRRPVCGLFQRQCRKSVGRKIRAGFRVDRRPRRSRGLPRGGGLVRQLRPVQPSRCS